MSERCNGPACQSHFMRHGCHRLHIAPKVVRVSRLSQQLPTEEVGTVDHWRASLCPRPAAMQSTAERKGKGLLSSLKSAFSRKRECAFSPVLPRAPRGPVAADTVALQHCTTAHACWLLVVGACSFTAALCGGPTGSRSCNQVHVSARAESPEGGQGISMIQCLSVVGVRPRSWYTVQMRCGSTRFHDFITPGPP